MTANIEESAGSYSDYARQTIIRAVEILQTARTGTSWSVREALARADRELRADHTRQGPTFSLTAIEKALNEHLQEEENRKKPSAPLERMEAGPGPMEVAATLRQAAPEVAEAIRSEIIVQERALNKLAQADVTEEEINQLIKEVRAETRRGNLALGLLGLHGQDSYGQGI